MWTAPPIIFEGEDEAELKNRFVELCALYPERDIYDVGTYIFQNLKDAGLRGQQAALAWSKDIEIQERIRLFRLNGGHSAPALPDRDQLSAEILALARCDKRNAKERTDAYKLVAEIQGFITKHVEKVQENRGGLPAFNFEVAPE